MMLRGAHADNHCDYLREDLSFLIVIYMITREQVALTIAARAAISNK